jgi:hypothetical protein
MDRSESPSAGPSQTLRPTRCNAPTTVDLLSQIDDHEGEAPHLHFRRDQTPSRGSSPENTKSEAEIWNLVARLVASQNPSFQTAFSPEFRVLLEHIFSDGYSQALNAGKHPDPHYCSPCKATSLRKRIIRVSTRTTAGQEDLVKDFAFLSLWMDTGKIGQIKLFVTKLLASNISYCFTHSITQINCLDHLRLAELLESILLSLHDREIQVKSIICDWMNYQLKTLDCCDRASIQRSLSASNRRSAEMRQASERSDNSEGFCRRIACE